MEDNIFRKLFDSFASRTAITLFGIVGTVITIYAFLQEKKVDLRYEVIANTNVLDFNADISKLEVIYDSTNLKQTQENLRIYTVKVINNGDQNIIKGFYDENEPLGIQISSGKLIEQPQLIQTSNDYIKRTLKFVDFQKDRVSFSQVIIESGEYFVIKLLVLHKKDAIPNIVSYGKIAGQKNIEVVNAIDVKDETTFLGKTFFGNIWVQLLRLLAYFISGLIIVIIIAISSSEIDDFRNKKRRIKTVEEFKNLKTYQYTRMDDAIFDRYKKSNSNPFRKMALLITNEEQLNNTYNNLTEKLKSKEYRRYRRYRRIDDDNTIHYLEPDDFSIINKMINDGIVFREQDRLVINQAMKDTLEKFIEFLKSKGEFSMRNSRVITDVSNDDDDTTVDEKS